MFKDVLSLTLFNPIVFDSIALEISRVKHSLSKMTVEQPCYFGNNMRVFYLNSIFKQTKKKTIMFR